MSQKRDLEVSEGNGSNKRMRNAELIGKVVLMKKKVLDADDLFASWKDWWDEVKHKKVCFQLISADCQDAENEFRAKVGKVAFLQNWNSTKAPLTAAEVHFDIKFEWTEDFGVPGAFKVTNNHHSEFYLRSLTLEDVPKHGEVHFVCNSWVYPYKKYNYDRIFFSNETYLPSATPEALIRYRADELKHLRGNGEGELKEWDRVYDYAIYNDLGNPDRGLKYKRPTLGGSSDLPYPRRGRTSRPPAKKDPECESRIPILKSLEIYVPRDERFSPVKMSDAIAYGAKVAGPFTRAEIGGIDFTPNEFDSIDDMLKIYSSSPLSQPGGHLLEQIKQFVPFEVVKELLRRDGEPFKFPVPQVIEKNPSAWRTDEEFTREMLAGINPVIIRRLEECPPISKLDLEVYGNQTSKITKELIERCHKGLNVDEALESKKLFILDHHDTVMPFLRRINNNTSTKTYATRMILLLKDDGTLKPLAIELSSPDPRGDHFGPVSEVHLPAENGVEASIWQLAKAYVAVNDSGVHQIISHWLRTHASMEPFIIATHRQLSVLHPIYKLLHPHFRDTMHINALGRQILINAGGALENTVFPGEYSMEMSSVYYRNWVFTEQALPADLIKRGIAVGNGKTPGDVHLLIKDYPFAVDGLKIWFAIKTWVHNYCSFYYKNQEMLQNDSELQEWWNEIRTKGHGDKKDEPWWPKMQTLDELVESCTTIIWLASAYHAAINFGQYPYGGYIANRPSLSRRLVPKPGTPEYEELEASPEKAFLKTITAEFQTLLGISLIEILSMHTADEVYLGHREKGWTTDGKPLEDLKKFNESLEEIERKILEMNADETLRNRAGPAEMPYTLLVPSSDTGLTGRGIPNSISI